MFLRSSGLKTPPEITNSRTIVLEVYFKLKITGEVMAITVQKEEIRVCVSSFEFSTVF